MTYPSDNYKAVYVGYILKRSNKFKRKRKCSIKSLTHSFFLLSQYFQEVMGNTSTQTTTAFHTRLNGRVAGIKSKQYMIISVKLTKLTKNLNYIKFSYIILDFTMLRYSNNIYCLQEGSTPFGVKVLANFGLESLKHFGVKNGRRKIDKIQKSF